MDDINSHLHFQIIFILQQVLMSKIKILLTLALILSFSYALTVSSVTLKDGLPGDLRGSIRGGTKLYIEGLGFSSVMSDNTILVGEFPCNLQDGATATAMVCSTSAPPEYKQYWSLDIIVIVDKIGARVAPQKFSYTHSTTPFIQSVTPSVSYGGAGTKLYFYGVHRIFNLGDDKDQGDVYAISIGDSLVSRYGISQEPIGSNSLEIIQGFQPTLQKAGKYMVEEYLFPGKSTSSQLTWKSTTDNNDKFQFVVLPLVNSTTQSGSAAGQQLLIKGTGFPLDMKDVTVEVDNVNCKVTESTFTALKCTLEPKVTQTAKLDSNIATPVNPYVSGSGFFYKRYDITGISSYSYQQLKRQLDTNNMTGLTLQDEYISGEIRSQNVYGSNYGQVWKGYFLATVAGAYKFRGIADDNFAVYLNNATYGSTTAFPNDTHQRVAFSGSYQAVDVFANYYVTDIATAESDYITLEAGKHYYMQVYHINGAAGGKFSLSVEVPNTDTTVVNSQTYEVHTLTTSITEDPQIIEFFSTNARNGTINLRYFLTDPKTLKTLVNQNVTFAYNTTASDFCSKLGQISWFGPYGISCTLTMVDADGLDTTNHSMGFNFTWRVTIEKFRTAAHIAREFKATYSGGVGAFSRINIQDHSPQMSGTFSLTLDGVSIKTRNVTTGLFTVTDIPFDISWSDLQGAFRQINGFKLVRVRRGGIPKIGAKWVIYYIGYNLDLPDLVVSGAGLLGGKAGTLPQILSATRRDFTTNLFVDSIDYRWMRTFSAKPNVRVTVSGIPSACNTDCTYDFLPTVPTVTAASLTGAVLSLTLEDPAPLNAALTAITVFLDNQPCTGITGTMTSFTCTLPTNPSPNGTPKLTAGSHYPKVFISPVGYIQNTGTVNPINIPLTLSSVTASSGGINGGYEVTIAAIGVPQDQSKIQFTLCAQICTVTSLTNIQAKLMVPACATQGLRNIQASFNSLTSTVGFTYANITDSVTITSISPTSWSPVLKGVINIVGTGFGTNKDLLTVYLTNSSGNIYRMKVLEATSTLIKAGIPGGLPGQFDVNVVVAGFGNAIATPSTANDFKYEVVIDSILPATGSFNGGTLLTITGRNFVADTLDTMVTIGNELNQLCKIQSITATQIKCRSPPKNFYYPVNTPQIVVVDSKLIIQTDMTCPVASCNFAFTDIDVSPLLESLTSTSVDGGDQLTLTGQRFDAGQMIVAGSVIKVSITNNITRKVTEVQALAGSTTNATSITIIFPNVESGIYSVRVRSDPVGESNSLTVTVSFKFSALTPTQYSINGGKVTLTGTGFPETWPNKHYNRLAFAIGSRNLPLTIESMTPGQIVLNVPKGPSNRQYSFSVTNPMGLTKSVSFIQHNDATPNVNLISTSSIPSNTETLVTLNKTKQTATIPQIVLLYSVSNPDWTYPITNFNGTGATITFNVTLNSGMYGFRLYDNTLGWYQTSAASLLSVQKNGTYTSSNISTSFNGGQITITGNNIGDGAIIKVNGLVGTVSSSTSTSATFKVPKLITPTTQNKFKLAKNSTINLADKVTWGDSQGWEAAFDMQHATMYNSNNTACSVGIDIGKGLGVQLTRVRYFPNPSWNIAYQFIKGATIEVSNDNITYTTIATVDQTVHAGWNSFMISNVNIFRYVRFSHTSLSKCNLAQMELSGIIMSDAIVPNTFSFESMIQFNDGLTIQNLASVAVSYKEDFTPIVTDVTPNKGDVFGNYPIKLTGLYFNVGTPVIKVDGINCAVINSTATQIYCTVGSRLALPNEVSFSVMIGSSPAINRKSFRYVMKWSDHRTWGTDLPPVADDLVYVPKGMHLLVDQSTPILQGIIVENGTIEFSNDVDMVVQAQFITLRGGEFIAGTQENPHTRKLTFIMHGNYYSPQQPMFGNKGIGCLECKFSMHGKKRDRTWTLLAQTVDAGKNIITVMDTVDWQVGQQIVIASTSYDHNEAEQMTIKSITGNVITVDKNFVYSHYSESESYGTGTDKIEMRAEVGLLTRNIKMMGDDTSVQTDYGSHLMLTGSAQNGLVGKIAYTQFTKCGQPQITGRYCHHFHMSGDVPESYSIGNSVHHSMARILTIHGVHFLYVAWNIGYQVKGHNFFLQDGVQTNNVLEYNLVISSLLSNNMMQTDMSVASFWVTNPTNHLRFNRAAGSDFYGFWYEIKEHPDGPSATQDVCPIGNPLGESHDNVAHSNVRFGLRIFKLYSREKPCEQIRNDKDVDPWAANPSVFSKFYNYVLWKNGQAGVLAEQTGNMLFQNFTLAENKLAGLQFYKANFTKQNVKAKNFIIIGKSSGNPPKTSSQLNRAIGVILPRTGTVELEDIRFYSFPTQTKVWQACSKCNQLKLYTNFGATYYASKIKYSGVSGPLYSMLGMKRQIFYDVDGSLTNQYFDGTNRTSATLVFGYPHLLQDPACVKASTANLSFWDGAAVCNPTVTVRSVMFANLNNNQEFKSQPIKARMLTNISHFTDKNQTVLTTAYSLQGSKQPKKQNKFTYSLPYLTDRLYQIWWGTGIDFQHVAVVTSEHWKSTDAGSIFKFNYTDNRQLFEIAPIRQGKTFNYNQMKSVSVNSLDKTTCGNGDYFHNNADNQRTLHVCASGKNRSYFEHISVNAIICRYLCPAPPGSCDRQATTRQWSNATQWPNGVMPSAGQNVTIPCEWTIIMNIQPERMGYWEINGNVVIQDTQDLTIIAQNIWIKGGSLKAGTSAIPVKKAITIQLNGVKDALGFVVSPQLAGNKMFVVTGKLELFGTAPATTWTRMTAFADAGTNSITVASASGWKIGDEIGIAPSFSGQKQFEKVTITGITSNTVSFTPALQYNHFGASSATITRPYGTLDMRTGVAHLSRNIKIKAGADDGWGFTLIQFGYMKQVNKVEVIETGKMTISGVQFIKGGQYDTQQAALQILNVRAETQPTLITKSSFHGCQDFCMKIQNAYDIQITNNVFFNARKFHVRALDIYQFTFTNNLMIGVTKRPTMIFKDLIACFASYKAVDPTSDNITVTNNLCQGSQGQGFAVPHVDCKDIDIYPFAGNTAGSCQVGWLFARGVGTCLSARGVYAYASQIGQIHNPVGTITTKFKNFIMADNRRSITIRIGGLSQDKTGYLLDSYITAIARPTCGKCYKDTATICTGNHGMRMLAPGSNGEQLPGKFGTGFDVICKLQTIDAKVYIYNTEFNNFNQTYSLLPQCSNNVIFKPHDGGSVVTGSSHLFNTTCTSCQIEAYAFFKSPPISELGWFGGCGSILCTGNNNYIIQDHSGTFLPAKGTLLANNSWIGDNTPSCTKIPSINGHYCTESAFSVLQYESVAPDFNKRIMWPVYLKYDGGNWTTQTNGWKQWQWNGGEPLNARVGRFVSTIRLNQTYNMSFVSMPPEDMTLKLQKRIPEGDKTDWIIVKLYYPKPNSIKVQVGGVTVRPISLLDNNGQTPLNTSLCGSNKFFYKNYTIHFVVTGDANCLVRVSLTSSIQLTARFDMPIADFFKDDGVTRFINRMAALLKINDTSRIKVVGVYAGSVIITTEILPTSVSLDSSTTADPNAIYNEVVALQAAVNDVINSGTFSTAMTGIGFGPVTQVSSTIIGQDPAAVPKQGQNGKNDTGIIIGIVLGATFIVCLAVVGSVCYMRKRAKIGQFQNQQLPIESDSHKQGATNQKVISSDNFSLVDLKQAKKQLY